MKKIFTLLAAACLCGSFSSKADSATQEDVYFSIDTYVDNKYTSVSYFNSDLIKNADGSFTVADFMDSGSPVTFKFETPEINGYAEMEYLSDLKYVDGDTWPYLGDKDGDYMTCYIYNFSNNAWDYFYSPYVFYGVMDGYYYSYVYRYDKSDSINEYEYYGEFDLAGWVNDDTQTSYYYITFYFNDPESSGISEVTVDNADAPVEYYNLQGVKVAEPANGLYIRRQGSSVSKVVL